MTRATQPRAHRRVLSGLAALAIVALAAGPASAHAKLLGSAPGDGATVTDPQAAVILEFNEAVGAPELTVASPDGQPLALAAPEAQDRRVIQPLPPLTQQGVYSVTYQVISSDKDPIGGRLAFTYTGPVQQAQPAPPPAPATADDERSAAESQAARPTPEARTSWPIFLVTAVVLLGVIGAAWYAFSRNSGASP